MGSPININNYINIYTSKSPVSNQINFNSNHNHYGLHQAKKSVNLGQVSFEKSINSINNLSQKQISSILDHSHATSQERYKFNSVEKQVLPSSTLHHNGSQNYIKYSPYDSQNTRGYLSNFKERFNPNPKVKKFYRAIEKQNINFNQATSYKH